jgi:S-adenosylmethionine decarboxylase
MAVEIDSGNHPGPFEGPEKLLEIWFAPSAQHVHDAFVASRPQGVDVEDIQEGKYGLRAVERRVWDEMLDIVKCKVLSVVYGEEIDAYLLRCAFE